MSVSPDSSVIGKDVWAKLKEAKATRTLALKATTSITSLPAPKVKRQARVALTMRAAGLMPKANVAEAAPLICCLLLAWPRSPGLWEQQALWTVMQRREHCSRRDGQRCKCDRPR
jgi:hypothetical protein